METISSKAYDILAVDSVSPDLLVVERGAFEIKLK